MAGLHESLETSFQRETTQDGDGRVETPAEGMYRCHPPDATRVAAAHLSGQRQRRWRHPRGSHCEDSPSASGSPTRGCRLALLLPRMVQVLQQRVLARTHMWRRVFCAGPLGGTCALQRAGDAITQLLAAKHTRDMSGWFSAVERFHTLHDHAVVAFDAQHQLSLVAQGGNSARSSAFGCWRCRNPNLNPKP